MDDKGYGWDDISKEILERYMKLERDMKLPTYGLEGKNLSKKGAYEYPSEVNMEELYGEKEEKHGQVCVGGADVYMPLCRHHYVEHTGPQRIVEKA